MPETLLEKIMAIKDKAKELCDTEDRDWLSEKLLKISEINLSESIVGIMGSADEAVAALIANALQYNPNVRCSHHDHEHGEGHSCGSHGDGHSCGSHGEGHSCGSHGCGNH